jgi:amidophosphoribosyltransferase
MSDQIQHECGIAMVRLRKPLEYYYAKYGTSLYGIHKLHLLMEKQHNRGQDGAGAACIKFDLDPGKKYIDRERSNSGSPIKDLFSSIYSKYAEVEAENPKRLNDVNWMKENIPFTGELFLGHLRYGTFGGHDIEKLHPVKRSNNWKSKNLVVAGNFNLTNVDELFQRLVEIGQHPVETSDTITVLEKIGHYLDEENEILYRKFRDEGYSKKEISAKIAEGIEVSNILKNASQYWDGGFAIGGMLGHGDSFIMRDPAGIRPAFYYVDDEVIVAASERPVIQTAFNLKAEDVKEITPGHALIIKKNGEYTLERYKNSEVIKPCSFERIYFSRGTDIDIYNERKKLGALLVPTILKSVNHDLDHTVFSFIPNTALVAFYGMVQELDKYCNRIKKDRILEAGKDVSNDELEKILHLRPRVENVAVKDVKMRTFITQDSQRDDLVAHVYDITYGSLESGVDTLVVTDDSIVRGTTLKQSIIRILDRLGPRKIVIASSAPQIRYPDCYGIDMAKLKDFIAFNAAIELLKDTKQDHIINEVYNKCKAQENLPKEEIVNYVKDIYRPFTAEQISAKIAELVTPKNINAEIEVIYQTIEDLHEAIPVHNGDWYFTGNYPTPGGNKVVNKAFINYVEGKDIRAY